MAFLRKGISYTLMFVGGVSLLVLLAVVTAIAAVPNFSFEELVNKMTQPQTETTTVPRADTIHVVFRNTLQSEVRSRIGMPIEGYVPSMFLTIFPGLTETDFEGVEASIGYYTMEQGRLVHKLDTSGLIHSAATAITDHGLDTLLQNISDRLKVDLEKDGTLTLIMDALVRGEKGEATMPPETVACTMDAKICPDGSAVGRTGPSCEFAPCP